MICLVDNTIDGQGASPRELKGALERMRPGIEIIIEPFLNVSLRQVEQLAPTHIILSGQSHPWEDYRPESLNAIFEVIREAKQPILGVCGGHQQIALAYGAPVGLIKRIAPGTGYEGAFRERGFFPVQLLNKKASNGIFQGLPESITVWHSHCDEVKELPPGFRRTAANETCLIQAMEHASRRLFGVQFHPELFNVDQPHGRRIIENFLDL
jgi:GMP synthase (glutamine-hydrolysing)